MSKYLKKTLCNVCCVSSFGISFTVKITSSKRKDMIYCIHSGKVGAIKYLEEFTIGVKNVKKSYT